MDILWSGCPSWAQQTHGINIKAESDDCNVTAADACSPLLSALRQSEQRRKCHDGIFDLMSWRRALGGIHYLYTSIIHDVVYPSRIDQVLLLSWDAKICKLLSVVRVCEAHRGRFSQNNRVVLACSPTRSFRRSRATRVESCSIQRKKKRFSLEDL